MRLVFLAFIISGCAMTPKENVYFCADDIVITQPKITPKDFRSELERCLEEEYL